MDHQRIRTTSVYLLVSAAAASVTVWHALATRQQFFPSMVYLAGSKLSVAVLGNLGFAVALSLYKLITLMFLGRLRDFEVERINDKISQAIVETLLAMTIFRQDFTVSFVSMFVVLTFVKIFHWLVQDRVDFIETTPNVTRSAHARIVAFLGLLIGIDVAMLQFTLGMTLTQGVSVHLLFAFEYAIQASTAAVTLVKYGLSIADMALEGRWEGKGVAVFYLELTLDLLHLITYSAFFAVVFSTYGIPLHLVRDLYWTFRNFQTRVRDFLRYRRVSANMERRFPDATQEDLERAGGVCIVCREEMAAGSRCKRLDCSHSFHLHCLRSWLERQQNCPICRAAVTVSGEAQARRGQEQAAAGPAAAAVPAAQQQPGGANEERFMAALRRAAEAVEQAEAVLQRREARGVAAAGDAAPVQGQGQGQGIRQRRPRGGRAPAAGIQPGQAPPQPHPDADQQFVWARGEEAHYLPHEMQQQQVQWVPATTMALFVPAGGLQPMQYAGQQHPEVAAAQGAGGGVMPFMVPMMMTPGYGSPGMMSSHGAGSPQPSASGVSPAMTPSPVQHQTASAIAAAAAAAAAAVLSGSPPPPSVPTDPAIAAAMRASAEALEATLQQQLQSVQTHLQQLRLPSPNEPAQQSGQLPEGVSASGEASAGASGIGSQEAAGGAAGQGEGGRPSMSEDDIEHMRRRWRQFQANNDAAENARD